MEIIGNLIEKRETRQASATFTVREFVVEVENPRDSRYNDYLLCQLTGDRCALLDQFNIGEKVQVTFDLRGRKWTTPDGTIRYITSLNAWRIDRYQPGMPQPGMPQPGGYQGQQTPQPTQPVQPGQPTAGSGAADFGGGDSVSDLPF